MRVKKLLSTIVACTLMLSLVACSSGKNENASQNEGNPTQEASTDNGSEGGVKIGVLMKTMSDTYSNKLGTAIQSYVETQYPDATLYLLDGQADIAKQISQAEDLIAKKVNVIILNPQDADGSAQVLDLAASANIPVVEVNTETTRTDYASFVGSEDVEAGEIMGKYVTEQLGGSGKIAILEGEMGQSAQIKRYEGLENTILKEAGIECVATLSASWSRSTAMSTTEDWLGKYKDLKAIICENDDMAMGALQACESQNREMIIIGTDAIPDALQAIKDGRLSATVLQDAAGQASTSVDVAVKVANGEEVDSRYKVDFQLITSENVDQYINQ
ncbi:MAG: periplasmic binding protein/LacI transcriptional regulator [Herbinix sp.]|jgi:ABC-type sugar transport system substrate-binding protein|nr:periplasmic binding protein/LacI transcriptional regulator [Herbinix sp.]